jgi:hypothetical protein
MALAQPTNRRVYVPILSSESDGFNRLQGFKQLMEQVGKTMVAVGLATALLGAMVWLGLFKWLRFGRLPGDIAIERNGGGFYFPVVSMLIVSAVLTIVLWIIGALRK